MPRRSTIDLLPADTRAAIQNFVEERGFGNYRETAAEIATRWGVRLSRSALTRYGAKLDNRIQLLRVATAQARTIVQEVGADDARAIGEATLRLAQSHIFDALLRATADALGKPNLLALAASAADLERTRLAEERRRAASDRARVIEAESSQPETAELVPAGLDASSVDALRARLAGDGDE